MAYLQDYEGNYISDINGNLITDYTFIDSNKTINLNFFSDLQITLKFFDNAKNYIKQSYDSLINYVQEV